MNTFFILCIAGIILNSAGITFDLYILNIAGAIFTTVGILKLEISGLIIRKAKRYAIISIPFAVLAFVLSLAGLDNQTLSGIQLGINIFFYIYFTYYFTEALIEHAKMKNELAITRSFHSIWTLCGIVAFLYFMAYTSLVPIVVSIAKIILLISALYYTFSIYNASKHLFPAK